MSNQALKLGLIILIACALGACQSRQETNEYAGPAVTKLQTETGATKLPAGALPVGATPRAVAELKAVRLPHAATKPQVRRIEELDVYALAPSAYLLAYGHMLKASAYLRTEKLSVLSPHINAASLKTGLEPALIAAVIMVESGAVHEAVSNKGALGLMQLMPETARELELDEPFDPAANILAGSTYLKQQLKRFGRVDLALAAYNAGPQAVLRAQGIPHFAETQGFVRKVLTTYAQLKSQH